MHSNRQPEYVPPRDEIAAGLAHKIPPKTGGSAAMDSLRACFYVAEDFRTEGACVNNNANLVEKKKKT